MGNKIQPFTFQIDFDKNHNMGLIGRMQLTLVIYETSMTSASYSSTDINFNTDIPEQNGGHLADNIYKCIFFFRCTLHMHAINAYMANCIDESHN